MDEGRRFSIGVDIGGTFTDCVVVTPDGRSVTGKVPTTPADRSVGFFESIAEAAGRVDLSMPELLRRTRSLIHGTTTGVNALVSRTGATVGLVTTAGHGDVLLMMKGSGRTAGLSADVLMDELATRRKPAPFVPRARTVEIEERIDCDGDVVVSMDEGRARQQIAALLSTGVEAVAISLLWSIKNPVHEQRLREIVEEVAPGTFVSCGSDLISRIGEYERTITCVFNAYIGPLMREYIESIVSKARDNGFDDDVLFAQSAGGAIGAEEAKRSPVLTMQSGPVAGVMNSVRFGASLELPDLITTDMGGTTFDVSVIRKGEPFMRDATVFEQYEMAMPMLDIESIGAGGGSIAWVDQSGRLNVGPRSAGAEPGPACYGRGGTEPTVTDADVVLGIINPATFLHGEFDIDPALALDAYSTLGSKIGLDPYQAAAGVNRIVDASMADLIRRMSEFRGHDPRHFALLAFGGGGPVHAGACARDAGVPTVIVPTPELAPVWSAGGASNLDIVHVYQEPKLLSLPVDPSVIDDAFSRLEERAIAQLSGYGFERSEMTLARSVRMKHTMQIFDVEVPLAFDLAAAGGVDRLDALFSEVYEQRFGKNSGFHDGGVQMTGVQIRAVAARRTDRGLELPEAAAAEPAWSNRPVYWQETGGFAPTQILDMRGSASSRVEAIVDGPALIEFPNTVIVVRPAQRASFDRFGNVHLDTATKSSFQPVGSR